MNDVAWALQTARGVGSVRRADGGPVVPSFGLSKKANVATAINAAKGMGYDAREWSPTQKSPNAAMYSQGALHINKNHQFWADPVGNMKTQKERKHLSSDNPMHVIHHEIGHALYDAPDNWNGGHRESELAKEQVSNYAGMNPKEFVSEVHAGMQGGEKYSPEVMNRFAMYARKRAASGGQLSHLAQIPQYHPPHAHAHPIHKLHTGPLHSTVAGRTDHLPSNVPNGAYVFPADVVSGLGESNTLAGFKVAKRMFAGAKRHFGGTPYGGDGGPYGQGATPYGMASGGQSENSTHSSDSVPVAVAGGEHVLAPHEVAFAGMGDMDAGHRALDAFVLRQRANTVKTLRGLPGPKRGDE